MGMEKNMIRLGWITLGCRGLMVIFLSSWPGVMKKEG